MNIDIITLHRAENYGSVLQTFALQKKIEELGHTARILDYHPERYTNKGKLRRLKKQSKKINNPLLLLIAKILIYPSYLKKNKVFSDFVAKYLKLSPFSFATNDEVKGKLDEWADCYCTGSDQVWNSHWNECVEKALFLDFIPKTKPAISYAASIGLSQLPSNEIDETRNLLKKYIRISVRENSGVDIIKQLGFEDVEQCLDPTLLLMKEEWTNYVDDCDSGKEYILTYNLHHDPEIDKFAMALGRKYHAPVRNISYNWHDVVRKGHLCWCPSVERFLGLIKNAKFVVADSFHATVFSIIFEKQFVTITPEIASSRIASILQTLGIENRNLAKYMGVGAIEKPIDYVLVKRKLAIEVDRSMSFLKKALLAAKKCEGV